MAVEFTDYMNKVQEETLSAIKQVQDSNLAAMTSAREFFAGMPAMPWAPGDFPSTKKMIETSFEFTNRLMELRKQYTLEFAEIWAKAQKDAGQASTQAVRNVAPNIK